MKDRTDKIPDLPGSEDKEWDGAEKVPVTMTPVNICPTHTKDKWMDVENQYIDNHDGTISCKFCPWGAILPGFMRFVNGRVIDLRDPKKE